MKRGLLLALPLVLAGAAFWLLSGSAEGSGDAQARTAVPRSPEVGEVTASPAAAATNPGQVAEAARTGATADAAGGVPIPDDATWVEVLVVTGKQPVAGATVCWMDESTRMRARKALPVEELESLWNRPEDLAQRFGWQTRSSDRGIARVHVSEWTSVLAWHDGSYGTVTLQQHMPPPPGGHCLQLLRDLELCVQVLHADGTPAIDVPIQVLQLDATGKLLDSMNGVARTRSPDGRTRLQHLQSWTNHHWDDVSTIAEWRVRPHLVGTTDPGIRFDPKAPPAEPVVLRVPAFGSAKARVEYRGRPIRSGQDDACIWLYCGALEDWQARNCGWYRPMAADGWAHFSWVPLGATVTAVTQFGGTQVHATVAGPVHSGQEVTIALTPADDQIVLTARAVDAQRQPLRDQQLTVEVQRKGRRHHDSVRTDAEGRFQVFAGKPRGKDRLERLVLMLRDPDAEPLRGDSEPRDLVAGEQDLGDIVVAREPLVVSGNLVTGDKPYRRKLQIQVQRLGQPREGREQWEYLQALSIKLDEQGGFIVRGKIKEGRHRLSFPSSGSLPIAPVEFTPGATGVKVQIDPGSALVATFLLPPDVHTQLHAVLQPGPGVTVPRAEGASIHEDPCKADVATWERPQAQWRGLPSGSYTLEVRLEIDDEPLLVIPDVQVPPPENGDPRLLDIDLRSQLAVFKLTLADAGGAPLADHSALVFALGQDAGKEWQGVYLEDTAVRIVSRARPLDLLVAVPGFRPQELRGVRSDTVVRLNPWPEIELVFADLPALPEGTQLYAQLTPPPAERDGSYRIRWSQGSRSEYMRPDYERQEVESSRVRLPIGDGAHALSVSIDKGGDTFRVDGVTPAEVVYGGAGTVKVQVPAEALQRALSREAK